MDGSDLASLNRRRGDEANYRSLLSDAYAKLGAQTTIPAIDRTLWAIRVGGPRRMFVSCPCNNALAQDEMRMMHLLACYQHGAAPAARLAMRELLLPAAARLIHQHLTVWAETMECVGLSLPMRDWNLPELRGTPAPTPNPEERSATIIFLH